ncbi:hypothetical protein [Nannocystis sp. SCPEA4]|uniref:hypothetical protein n=1 Tax=Nannocystis sp. SCPEA4 TaxID=2996787 RepID=UPI00226F279B|nr:hypothetical protein [Nannocystis sp. SCPEA4]MCY1053928.1 hypothetical protein [Nannocystis sp. SCPEA4]
MSTTGPSAVRHTMIIRGRIGALLGERRDRSVDRGRCDSSDMSFCSYKNMSVTWS